MSNPGVPPAAPPRRVLLIQLRRLGDVTLSTAVLEDLRREFPAVKLDWLVGRGGAALLEHHPLINRRLSLGNSPARTLRTVRARHYDWVIDMQGSARTAAITAFSGAPVRAGWRARGRSWAYTHKAARATASPPIYAVRDRQRLLQLLGVSTGSTQPRLYLSEAERDRGAAVARAAAGVGPRVGMCLSTGHPAKSWPAARFAAVALALAREGVGCVVLQPPGDETEIAEFRAAAADNVPIVSLRDREFMAVAAGCDVFLSGDTGPAHIATALRVPRVTLFGPTPPEGWTPDLPTAVAVRGDSARCAGCARGSLEVPHTCMDAITPEMVLAPVRELLRSSTRRITA